jgi:AcrR family transcriptional regulator
MIAAAGTHGYNQTSVNRLVALAGVSRRSFYEHFSNREECFQATYDLIVGRLLTLMNQACRSREGDLECHVRAALEVLGQEIQTNPKTLRLVLAEAPIVGPRGMARLHETLKLCEHMIGVSFFESEAHSMPRPIARALTGGLQRMVLHHLREGHASQIPSLTDEMTKWITCFDTSTASRLSPAADVLTAGALDQHVRAEATDDTGALLRKVALELTLSEGYSELSAMRIADEAGISANSFLEAYADQDECFLDALDVLSEDLLAIAADPGLTGSEWAIAVHRVLGALMCHLAANPLDARTLARSTFMAGPVAITRNFVLARDLATLLTEGAPTKSAALTTEAIAGAIWHTISSQVQADKVYLLAALSSYLSYVVITPFLGGQKAIEVIDSQASKKFE